MSQFNIISNSSPLIAFIKKRDFGLLKSLFGNITIPHAVYNEITNTPKNLVDERKILDVAIQDKFIKVKKIQSFRFPDLNLGKGELEAINLAFEINNPLLLIDEKKGIKVANTFNIQTLGTLGILLLAKKKGIRKFDELIENIETLIKENFYLSSDLITKFIKEIKD
ncbi:MAG: DUF3368 domain-containing protein [Candidatus Helarchaeota archaeon]